jgi:hypothetical protein
MTNIFDNPGKVWYKGLNLVGGPAFADETNIVPIAFSSIAILILVLVALLVQERLAVGGVAA